jgi:hypothetical protein
MALDAFWQNLEKTQSSRSEDFQRRWRETALALANGKTVDPAVVDQLLGDVGYTVANYDSGLAELKAYVGHLTKRMEERAKWDRARTIAGERDEINVQIAAATTAHDAAVQAARAKYESMVAPRRARLVQLEREEREAAAAEQYLISTADAPAIVGRIANLEGEVTATNERIAAVLRRVGAATIKAQNLYARARAEQSQPLEAEAAVHAQAAEEARAEAEAMKPQLRELEQELAKEHALLLVP